MLDPKEEASFLPIEAIGFCGTHRQAFFVEAECPG